MSLSIGSNGENVDIRKKLQLDRSACEHEHYSYLRKGKVQIFLSMKIYIKELLIQRIASITFSLLNETLFSFDSTSSTSDMTTHAKGAMLISKLIFTSPLSLFDRSNPKQTVQR